MSYKLNKPYSEEQYSDFIVEFAQTLHLEETDECVYALEPYEKLIDGEVIECREEYENEQVEQRKAKFKKIFFNIPAIDGVFKGGWYRKRPKGFQSAIESINTVYNAVSVIGKLPAGYLTFYNAPNFLDENQCNEEWFVANQFTNAEMTLEQFMKFYTKFITIWNNVEHK